MNRMSRERHEQDELAQDEAHADFDLGRDIAQPTAPTGPVDFDLAKDIGIENEPDDLRG